MSLTSYRAAPPRGTDVGLLLQPGIICFAGARRRSSCAVRRGLLRVRRRAAIGVCYPVYLSEAKRPLEGGPVVSAEPEFEEKMIWYLFLPLIDLAATYSPAS